MISRLSISATAFACIATTTIGWAASTSPLDPGLRAAVGTAQGTTPIVRLETVVIVGRRAAATVR